MTKFPPFPHSASSDNPERRRFSSSERIDLFVAAGGHCAACGIALSAGWHADHVRPYVAGGPTRVDNGQALCPQCNLRKGARMSGLRPWQVDAVAKYEAKNALDFLCSATPGAGKTTFALEIARRLMLAGIVERVVVVVPTKHLRKQWDTASSRAGIRLDPFLENDRAAPESSDYDGCCVTYQQVASRPGFHATLCRRPTFVIFDEIHHAGDERAWGDAARLAFAGAVRRLCLTGTPFRDDGSAIPFVEYDGDGNLVLDASYAYGQALKDGAVRPIVFPSFEGNMEWWSAAKGDMAASFADVIPSEEEARRLRTALEPAGDWLREVIRQADERLMDVRRNVFASAAGLVVATDIPHARRIADVMRTLIGVEPVIALSDEEDASRKIREFGLGGAGASRWLVAVKMVSEGVDIPRLCVGVWATTTRTHLFFRQVVGRFVRMLPDIEDQTGYLYIPSVDPLKSYVATIKEEIKVAIQSDDDIDDLEIDEEGMTERGSLAESFSPGRSEAFEDRTFVTGDAEFSSDEMSRVRRHRMEHGLEFVADHVLARVLRTVPGFYTQAGANVPPAHPSDTTMRDAATLHERKDSLRRRVRALMNQYIQAARDRGIEVDRQVAYTDLMRRQQVAQADATEDQLRERIVIISEWIDVVQRSGRTAAHD